MSTILQIVTAAAKRCGITNTVSAAVGSTDNNIISLVTFAEDAVAAMRDSGEWPELEKEYTFTLATSTASYALPADFNHHLYDTHWNRDNMWPLLGPLTPEMWQFRKSGISAATARNEYRVKGYADKEVFIHPTPASGDNGQTVAFEYQSKTCIRPKTWVASTSWSGIQYCFYNGNIYDRGGTGAGTTGTTPPTHTTGSSSDGGITWTYTLSPYASFVHDSDVPLLDNDIVVDETVWRWKRQYGFDFEQLKAESEQTIAHKLMSKRSATNINLRLRKGDFWRYYPIVPDGNWPT